MDCQVPKPIPGILSPVFRVNTVLYQHRKQIDVGFKHAVSYLVPFPACEVDMVRIVEVEVEAVELRVLLNEDSLVSAV